MKKGLFFAFICVSLSCHCQLYFPPVAGSTWQTVSPSSLGWCPDKVDSLEVYLGNHNTKAFILLKDGKIAIEKYYGTFTGDSVWYWASAGKTMTAFLVGLAQEQGYLNIHDSLPKYLGHGFSSCTPSAEDSIRIIHQLTMTTGFDDKYGGVASENHCTDDSCLVCLAQPSTRWAYHNAPYTLLDTVINSATGLPLNTWKTNQLNARTGITGLFIKNGYDNVYYSKPRSFARFGLLMLNNGAWQTDTIMHDTAFYHAMTRTSQNINPSYGYLWWLNGKSSYRLPNLQVSFPGMICPHAPMDMYAALGKNDQILNVVPSKGLVWIRMGDPFCTTNEVATNVCDSIWVKLNEVLCNSLPARLISFAVFRSGKSNTLKWLVTQENMVKEFAIERRASSNSSYRPIGSVTGVGSEYTFRDMSPAPSLNYYRLKMTMADGQIEYSPVRTVNNATDIISLPGDPVRNVLPVSITSLQQEQLVIQVYTTAGTRVMRQSITAGLGSFTFNLDISSLSQGSYFITISTPAKARMFTGRFTRM